MNSTGTIRRRDKYMNQASSKIGFVFLRKLIYERSRGN